MVLRCVLALALAAFVPAQQPFDLPALLDRLVAPDWLWRSPPAGERCVQFSSYDRASHRGPGDHGAWYANDDRGKHLRVVEKDGGKEFVMVDVAGPGCVARIWSANPQGTLHFDIDGARVWSVDFALLCSGLLEGVPEPLAGVRARGANCYLPLPFGKSLVVSCTSGETYYAFDVVQWPAGQAVQSFTPALLAAHAGTIRERCQALPLAGPVWTSDVGLRARREGIDRGRVVRALHVDFPAGLSAEKRSELARACLLVIRCGAEETVRVPLADFFAASHGWEPHNTRFLGVAGASGFCTFPMPMPDGGSIRIDTKQAVGDELPYLGMVFTEPLPASAEPPLLFRASYHLVKGTKTRPFTDHLVLDAKGKGRFVGCSLLVRNPSRIWWGEGDEKFTVDGEAFPSWFGTGTEDYFGYAWCDPTPFAAAFHAQIECQGPHNFGFTQLHRTHVLDSVPFQQSFRFDLERWHWVQDTTIDYATVAYWYGALGATSGLPPVPKAADRELPRLPSPPMFVAENALEGEALHVVSCTGGEHLVQDMTFLENTFSRDMQRWWRNGKVGDRLVLAVPVAAGGRYRVTMALTRADDYAIVARSLGGHDLGEFDGWNERVATTGPLDLGVVALPAGTAELVFVLRGNNPRSKPAMMVGLDWIRLEKVE